MGLAVVATWLALVGTWVLVYKATVRHRFGAPALFLYLVGLAFIVRPALVIFGAMDVRDPLLFHESIDSLAIDGMLFSIFWLAAFGVAFCAFREPARGLGRLLPRLEGEPNRQTWVIALIVITIPGAIAAFIAARHGQSLSGTVAIVRGEGFLDQVSFLRKLPQVALALSSAAVAYEVWSRRARNGSGERLIAARDKGSSRALLVVGIGTGIVNLLANLSFGDRSSLLIPVVLGWLVSRLMFKRRSLVRGAVVVVAAAVVLVYLGGARSAWKAGPGHEVDLQLSSVETITDAVNFESSDRLMLLMQDWRDPASWRWGEDFVIGIRGVVPRALWENKPDHLSTGTLFRGFYTGNENSGWPLKGWGEWYLEFGPLGVLVGGLLAGVTFRALDERYRGFERDPFAAGFMCLLVFYVFPNGIITYTPIIALLWLLPMHIVSGRMFRRRRPRAPSSVASRVLAPASR